MHHLTSISLIWNVLTPPSAQLARMPTKPCITFCSVAPSTSTIDTLFSSPWKEVQGSYHSPLAPKCNQASFQIYWQNTVLHSHSETWICPTHLIQTLVVGTGTWTCWTGLSWKEWQPSQHLVQRKPSRTRVMTKKIRRRRKAHTSPTTPHNIPPPPLRGWPTLPTHVHSPSFICFSFLSFLFAYSAHTHIILHFLSSILFFILFYFILYFHNIILHPPFFLPM